jgi:hypothetical protein
MKRAFILNNTSRMFRQTQPMTLIARSLPLWLSALLIAPGFTSAQNAVPAQQRRHLAPPGQNQAGQQSALLSSNHRITFSGKSGEKSLGELSALTCSPRVDIAGPLIDSENPATFGVSGTLSEKDGSIVFQHQITFSVPTTVATQVVQPGVRPVSNTSYQQHSTSGTLLMKPGKVYEVLKSGGNVCTISIAPEVAE